MLNIAEEGISYGCINCKKEKFNYFWNFYNHHFEPSVTITFHHVCHTLKSLCITELLQHALILHALNGTHHGCSTCNDTLFWLCFSPLTAFDFPGGPTTLTNFNFNFHLFCVCLIQRGYDPSNMELVNTENKVTNIIHDVRYNTINFSLLNTSKWKEK
jgi:hypothetical protein